MSKIRKLKSDSRNVTTDTSPYQFSEHLPLSARICCLVQLTQATVQLFSLSLSDFFMGPILALFNYTNINSLSLPAPFSLSWPLATLHKVLGGGDLLFHEFYSFSHSRERGGKIWGNGR